MPSISDSLARIGDLSVPFAPADAGPWRDDALLEAQRSIAEVNRRLASLAATVAAEIAHRSRRELGHSGLAATRGQRSAEGLISQVTGGSMRDARTLVKAGELIPTVTPRQSARPLADWLRVIGDAVGRATISTDAADIIRTRLDATALARRAAATAAVGTDGADSASDSAVGSDGSFGVEGATDVAAATASAESGPNGADRIDVSALTDAARDLVAAAPELTLEQLAVRAGRVRDELDLAGGEAREREQHDRRFLRLTPLPDGMVRLHGLLDRESAAIVTPIVDAITSPRRSGPRFVDPDTTPDAADMVRDERTPDQLVLDSVVDLIRAGSRVDDSRLLGDRKPAVRILVTDRDLNSAGDNGTGADAGTSFSRPGVAYFEGQTEPVSIATAERFICASGAIPILFDGDGQALDLGRTQRLFSDKQRIALAARDGGCIMCGRPPSWTEAHHIDHWDEHQGKTDVRDGVLLCRFCHLLVHNRGWRIRRDGAEYFLERPDDNGTVRRTPLPSRSPAHQRLLSSA